MLDLAPKIAAATTAIRAAWPVSPKVGIILGTGLGELAQQIEVQAVLGYDAVPHFPMSTAMGHKGQLVCGLLAGVNVVTMEGRFHAYEGYSLQEITLPVRVMKALGVEVLIVSNASGGLNPNYASGDIMVVDDHINLLGDNPLIGVNDDALGPRFPDMSCPYDPRLADQAMAIARRENFAAHRGIYVALRGPNFETRAEYRLLRRIGGDAVGMSTVPEVIVAVHAGLRVLALSTVTNICRPDALGKAKGEDIVAAAAAAEPKVRKIVMEVVRSSR
jgi:purine-nucleoside phosphorylase